MKYRRKNPEVDAVQMPDRNGDFTNAPNWLTAIMPSQLCYPYQNDPRKFELDGGIGRQRGEAGDYVMKFETGEILIMEKYRFEKLYERMEG